MKQLTTIQKLKGSMMFSRSTSPALAGRTTCMKSSSTAPAGSVRRTTPSAPGLRTFC